MSTNTNVEISERDGFKLFKNGFADYVRNGSRIDGGWHMSITRHLHVWLCTSDVLNREKKRLCATPAPNCIKWMRFFAGLLKELN